MRRCRNITCVDNRHTGTRDKEKGGGWKIIGKDTIACVTAGLLEIEEGRPPFASCLHSHEMGRPACFCSAQHNQGGH